MKSYEGIFVGIFVVFGILALYFLFQPREKFGPRCELKGITLSIYADSTEPEIVRDLREIRSSGFNTVLIKLAEVQEDWTSNVIAPDPANTISLHQLEKAISAASSLGLKTIVMPIVLLRHTTSPRQWRGMIRPTVVGEWFHSYQEMILKYARIAQRKGASFFVIGSELVSMEPYVGEWTRLIQTVRKEFGGKLLYSSNWDFLSTSPAWRELDLLGLNAYYELTKNEEEATATELERKWKSILPPILLWQNRYQKPILVTEIGYPSRAGALFDPWNHVRKDQPRHDLQWLGYSAFLSAWSSFSGLFGIVFYEWDVPGGPGDPGYSPRGKVTFEILEKWMQSN